MNKLCAYILAMGLALLLVLLTIAPSFNYSNAQEVKTETAKSAAGDKNPYSNSTEEKTPSCSLTINEEYVHEARPILFLFPMQVTTAYIHAHEAAYIAYHGELHCPPPNSQV